MKYKSTIPSICSPSKRIPSIEGSAYLSKRLVLDNGGEVEDVNPGLISINQDNGTSKKYISAAGQEHQKK